jgi:hypothetical protein
MMKKTRDVYTLLYWWNDAAGSVTGAVLGDLIETARRQVELRGIVAVAIVDRVGRVVVGQSAFEVQTVEGFEEVI